MNNINDLASKIYDNLSIKHKEIQKLDVVNKDLQNLQNLCDFPKILKEDIKGSLILKF